MALDLDGDTVRAGAHRASAASPPSPGARGRPRRRCAGQVLDEADAGRAAEAAFRGAKAHGENDFKPELGRRTLVRALLEAARMEMLRWPTSRTSA